MNYRDELVHKVLHEERPHWTKEQCAIFMNKISKEMEAHLVRCANKFLKDRLFFAEEV